jgi:hypothetical protein
MIRSSVGRPLSLYRWVQDVDSAVSQNEGTRQAIADCWQPIWLTENTNCQCCGSATSMQIAWT